jgi:hypothetical protein
MEGRLKEHHWGELRRETAEAKAERVRAEELGAPGLDPGGSGSAAQE